MYCFFIIVMLYFFLPPSLTKTNSMHVCVCVLTYLALHFILILKCCLMKTKVGELLWYM